MPRKYMRKHKDRTSKEDTERFGNQLNEQIASIEATQRRIEEEER